jgi:hypothetical protein
VVPFILSLHFSGARDQRRTLLGGLALVDGVALGGREIGVQAQCIAALQLCTKVGDGLFEVVSA